MAIVLTGLSHKTAPVEVRECLALSKEKVGAALERLVDGRGWAPACPPPREL